MLHLLPIGGISSRFMENSKLKTPPSLSLSLYIWTSKIQRPLSTSNSQLDTYPKPHPSQLLGTRNKMVVKATQQFSGLGSTCASKPAIPSVDLSKPESKHILVKSCEEHGFFKIINHGVPMELISRLESEAVRFFSLPASEKHKAGPPFPLGYGDKRIGPNGDMGWVEYLLLSTSTANQTGSIFHASSSFSQDDLHKFQKLVDCYISAVKSMACQILEMMADGLKIQPRDVFSKLLMDEKSDSLFRLNHYPPRPEINGDHSSSGNGVIGFGEHTDPQIISVLRSNNTSGLQISIGDDNWVPIPPDRDSFFVNVGDSLQVMTNGMFRSVRHRVMANSSKSRVSMIYFGGPPLSEKIAPVVSLLTNGDRESSLYREFTWLDYKKSVYTSRLAENKLQLFERIAAV